ncbi:reticulon-4 isoform X2 [Ornithorhynchus anatinus]|uniref:reticulon-4 isoform X2 n=1 Tax=Ornithorhynchus anatinus TaxID=9258 RepID=UPI0010A8FE76|nr:reticulon-4 isoform X2 [Ornithorhynchus anatinus]
MEDLDQSPLVSSSSAASAARRQPEFKYQFVREPEDDDEEEDEEEEEEEEEDNEELEVVQRKPPPVLAAAAAAAPGLPELGSDVPPAPRGPLPAPPPAPQPLQPPQPPQPPQLAPQPASTDEILFALPAASEPVMHSSAEKVMDLKEQPDAPSKECESLDHLPAVMPTKDILQDSSLDISKESTEKAKSPFVDRDFRDFPEMEYSEIGSSFAGSPKAESAVAGQPREEILVKNKEEKENVVSERVLQCPQDLPAVTLPKSAEEQDKILFSDKANFDKDSLDEKEGAVMLKENVSAREDYVDFKPSEQVWEIRDTCREVNNVGVGGANRESKLESSVDETYDADSLKEGSEKDSESSNEDISFPSSPEVLKDTSQAYITCAPFEPTVTTEALIPKAFPLLEDHTSENKTDEKKIAEKKAQILTEQKSTGIKATNPFLASADAPEADYVSTESPSKAPPKVVANMPEGLTPDLVQEAYESKMSDGAGPKLAYETKVDLVQTSESFQEPQHPAAQLCLSFESSEASPSPVLPDIVMEAPLNSLAPGAGASVGQLDSTPLETFAPTNYEQTKPEAENPPPYEEAVSVPLKKELEAKEEIKEPEQVSAAAEADAPYISIACDLIKETKVSTESTSPDLKDYSAPLISGGIGQPRPSDLLEDSSPDSEPVDLFSDDSIPEVPLQESEALPLVKENSVENLFSSEAEGGSKEKLNGTSPALGKPYLESFQPEDPSQTAVPLPSELTFTEVAKKEKIPLQMEELNTLIYSAADSFVSKEPNIREAVLSTDSSPIQIIEDFSPLVSSKASPTAQSARESPGQEKGEIADAQEEPWPLPCSELPHDLSLKSVQIEVEEKALALGLEKSPDVSKRDVPEVSHKSSLPADVSPLSEIVSVVQPKAVVKEAEKKPPSVSEKEERSPSALFSGELSKISVIDLLYWRDIKKTGVVFGASLFLLLSLTVFSIVSVTAYIALALLSVTISFRIYKGVIQAVQKSNEGHPFSAYLDSEVAISEDLVQKYSNSALGHVNCTIKELRRLFLVDDLVDSLKFAVLMWVFTYVGALFNGLTLLILALISLFSVPVIYERHQTQIDHYLGLVNKNVKDAMAKIQAKIPGLKRKAE